MKLRTKTGPIETECQEITPGCWEFTTGGVPKLLLWNYREGLGMNLSVKQMGDTSFQPLIYAKNLDHAIMFAQGFKAGRM